MRDINIIIVIGQMTFRVIARQAGCGLFHGHDWLITALAAASQ